MMKLVFEGVLSAFCTHMYSASLCVSSTDMPSSTHSPRPIELICSSPTARKHNKMNTGTEISGNAVPTEITTNLKKSDKGDFMFLHTQNFQVSIKALQAALDMCGYLQLQQICFSSWILETDLNLAVNALYLTVWGSLWPSVHWSSEIIPMHVSESIQCNLSHRCPREDMCKHQFLPLFKL